LGEAVIVATNFIEDKRLVYDVSVSSLPETGRYSGALPKTAPPFLKNSEVPVAGNHPLPDP
jgi:hypothetical protein